MASLSHCDICGAIQLQGPIWAICCPTSSMSQEGPALRTGHTNLCPAGQGWSQDGLQAISNAI